MTARRFPDPYAPLTGLARRKAIAAARGRIVADRMERAWRETVRAHYPGPGVDYAAVAGWCRSRRGQVIACENHGATWLPFEPFRVARANSSRGKGRVTREVVWTQENAA